MSNDIKIVYISNFSQFQSSRGHQISVFSKIQNSSNYPGGGGQENYGLFPHFYLDGSPNLKIFKIDKFE